MAEKHLIGVGTGRHTPYFQEETLEKGGAAVMRMVLGSEKVNLSPVPSQTDLYNDAVTRNRPGEPAGLWYLDPQGTRDSLMHFKPTTFTNSFVNYNFPSGAAGLVQANAKLVYTIDHYEVAPAVLVQGGAQWVAAVGYRTNNANELTSVFLNDPRPPIVDGSGDPPDFEVSASNWSGANYFRPVNRAGSFWHNQYATVCDPDKPGDELQVAKEYPLLPGNEIMSPGQAIELSQVLLRERGSLERELFARAIRQGEPARPHLVQILDHEDAFYYLVRWQIDGLDVAVVAIDARYGIFLEAIAYHRPLRFFRITPEQIPRLLTQGLRVEERIEDVRERIIGRLVQSMDLRLPGALPGWDMQHLRTMLEVELASLRRPVGHLVLRPEELIVHPVMVWQSSVESLSMLYPFYQVHTPKRRLYVLAADAAIYPELSPVHFQRLGG